MANSLWHPRQRCPVSGYTHSLTQYKHLQRGKLQLLVRSTRGTTGPPGQEKRDVYIFVEYPVEARKGDGNQGGKKKKREGKQCRKSRAVFTVMRRCVPAVLGKGRRLKEPRKKKAKLFSISYRISTSLFDERRFLRCTLPGYFDNSAVCVVLRSFISPSLRR